MYAPSYHIWKCRPGIQGHLEDVLDRHGVRFYTIKMPDERPAYPGYVFVGVTETPPLAFLEHSSRLLVLGEYAEISEGELVEAAALALYVGSIVRPGFDRFIERHGMLSLFPTPFQTLVQQVADRFGGRTGSSAYLVD